MLESNVHPDFLAQLKQLLPEAEIASFLDTCHRPLKKSISVDPTRRTPALHELVTSRGWKLKQTPFTENADTYRIDREDTSIALGNTALHQFGFFYMQEVAASIPAQIIPAEPGSLVLDMCAAPGGKTTQIAQKLMPVWGLVVANDVNPKRVTTLAHNVNKWRCYNSVVTQVNGGMFGNHLPDTFDHVLLDGPCSGEGTGFKSDVAMQFRHQAEINRIAGTQLQLLISSIKATKPGGTIIYSTCTLNPRENEWTLAKALAFFGDSVELIDHGLHQVAPGVSRQDTEWSFDQTDKCARFWPHLQGTGGFFVSRLRKKYSRDTKSATQQKLMPKNQFSVDHSQGLQNRVNTFLKENYGIIMPTDRYLRIATKTHICLTAPSFLKLAPLLQCEKVGIPVLKLEREGWRPTHYLWLLLGDLATHNTITVDDAAIQDYAQGKDIACPADYAKNSESNPILMRRGYGMSVTKLVDGMLKNKMGR